jgi:nucleotide-binding universal stress UspA family protein
LIRIKRRLTRALLPFWRAADHKLVTTRSSLARTSWAAALRAGFSIACIEATGLKTRAKFLEADTYVETGDPAECIIAFAKKSKCSEIVMGSRGLGRLSGLLLGSVVAKVVQLAEVPVVAVK